MGEDTTLCKPVNCSITMTVINKGEFVMDNFEKLCEAADLIINNIDDVLDDEEDTVLTESQIDDEIEETVDKYFEDVSVTMCKWTPEQRAYFIEKIDSMLEDSEPELMEERNIVRLDRNAVFNQLVGLFSLVIARRRKDPAFALYKKGSAIRRKAKNKIKSKYSAKAVPIARQYLRKSKRTFR